MLFFSSAFLLLVLALLHPIVSAEEDDGYPDDYNNSASRDSADVWLVVVLCCLFCFAVRHLNDFYAGDTITLVEEGIWGGRFRHRGEYRYLTQVEKDFDAMFTELRDKELFARHASDSSVTVDSD